MFGANIAGRRVGTGILLLCAAWLGFSVGGFGFALFTGESHYHHTYWVAGRALLEGNSPYSAADREEIAESQKHLIVRMCRFGNPEPIGIWEPRDRYDASATPFVHPPATVMLYSLQARSHLFPSAILWPWVQMMALLILSRQLLRYRSEDTDLSVRVLWFGLAAVLLALFAPTQVAFRTGHPIFVLVVLQLVALRNFDRGRDRAGAVPLAIAIILHPAAAVMTLYLLIKRRWRALASTALLYGSVMVAALLILGWSLHAEYLRSLTELLPTAMSHSLAYPVVNPVIAAVNAVASTAIVSGLLSNLYRAVILLPVFWLLYSRAWDSISPRTRLLELGTLYLAAVLSISQPGMHTLFYAIIALGALLFQLLDEWDPRLLAGLFVTYALIGLGYSYRSPGAGGWLASVLVSSQFAGMLILLALCLHVLMTEGTLEHASTTDLEAHHGDSMPG